MLGYVLSGQGSHASLDERDIYVSLTFDPPVKSFDFYYHVQGMDNNLQLEVNGCTFLLPDDQNFVGIGSTSSDVLIETVNFFTYHEPHHGLIAFNLDQIYMYDT